MNYKLTPAVLRQLIPLYLLLMVWFPVFVGYVIDADMVHPLTLLVSFIWMLVFTIPFAFFQRSFFYYAGVILYFFIGLIELSHWLIMKGPLTITSILNVFSTNMEEALDFVTLKLSYSLLVLLVYVAIFILALRNLPKLKNKKRYYRQVTVFTLIPLSFFLLAFSSIPKMRLVPQFVKVTYAFGAELKGYNELVNNNALKKVNISQPVTTGKQVVVLIIGESAARDRMSLYGFPKATTPLLKARKDLIVYTNVISPYSYTTLSVPSMVSNSNYQNKLSFHENIDIIDVFSSAGYKTYWYSNQSQVGLWDNIVSAIANNSEEVGFVNAAGNSSQEVLHSRSYDGRLFEPFVEAIEEEGDKKLIVLHLLGSHAAYKKRYPKEFDQFKGEGSRNQLIAEYHNSLLYSDFVINSILNTLDTYSAKTQIPAFALYVADHGENLYDEQDRAGHDFAKIMPKVNVEVPMFLWTSDTYESKFQEKILSAHANTDLPYMSDDIFHSILDMANINGPYFLPERSIINKYYDPNRPRIMADDNNYDDL